jgi:hypothetical protein
MFSDRWQGFSDRWQGASDLSESQLQAAHRTTDVARVLDRLHLIKSIASFDSTRALALVSVGPDADSLLERSVPHFLSQLEETHLKGGTDLLLGLNNGVDYPDLAQTLAALTGSSVHHIPLTRRLSPFEPGQQRDVHENVFQKRPSTGENRIFLVHQPSSVFAAGKIRMLADMLNLCFTSLEGGAMLPATLVFFDAETHFKELSANGEPSRNSNGIEALIKRIKDAHEPTIIGGRWYNVPYFSEGNFKGLPNYDEAAPDPSSAGVEASSINCCSIALLRKSFSPLRRLLKRA